MKAILKKENLLVIFILIISFFLRVYKINDLLGFYYDQGRDALVIWKLIHEGKFFLIGPVTGIEGIFLGPFYYYLIAPAYLFGGGSPVAASIWLSFISVIGVYILYLLTKNLFDKETGFLAILIYGLSFRFVDFSRWLSNPNPLPTFSLVVVYSLVMVYRGKEKFWLLAALFAGLSLQLEAASAIFFIPAIVIFTVWQKNKIKNWKYIFLAIGIFLTTLLPQLIFNFKHDNILGEAFNRFLISEKSFKVSFWQILIDRSKFYYQNFSSVFSLWRNSLNDLFVILFSILLIVYRKDFFKKETGILLIWIFTPLFFLLFYQGNNGYVWDYYLSGLWWVFVIFISFLFRKFAKIFLGKLFLFIFITLFIYSNFQQFNNYFKTGRGIILRNQLIAIDWIYRDAAEEQFNVDVYVPPVIPYAYDYLFKWYGNKVYGKEPLAKNVKLLYTLNEADYPHPERLESWLARQKGIGKIIDEADFGDIKIQKRDRIKYNE